MINTAFIDVAIALAAQNDQQSRIAGHHEAPELFDFMRSQHELPGTEYLTAHVVVVRPGTTIGQHSHEEDVVLYYAQPLTCPVEVDNALYMPEPGEIVVVPAGVMHSVPLNETKETRISIAMKVPVDG